MSPEPTDTAFLVGQARASFLESEAGNQVEVDLPPDLPQVMVDRQRALQVLDRLLSNAAGHSLEGAVITVSAQREDSHVAVCVAERGRDTPSQPQPLLFQRHSPVGGGGESVTGGEALGLAVCRGIGEAHGGRIWIERDGAGLGSRYIFTLPAAEETASGRVAPVGLPAGGHRRAARGHGRVLVVDDDPQALWHIRNTLTEAGYTPVATWDPEEVERLIAMERPHLVLLDSALTGADGSGLIQRISRVTDAPVLLLSGRGGTQGAGPCRGLRDRRRRLHRQALLHHRAGGPGGGGAATTGRAGEGAAPGLIPLGRPGHRLRDATRGDGRTGGGVDRYGVPAALRACD